MIMLRREVTNMFKQNIAHLNKILLICVVLFKPIEELVRRLCQRPGYELCVFSRLTSLLISCTQFGLKIGY